MKLFPVRDATAKKVIKSLTILFNTFGIPSRVISDRGAAFTSKDFPAFCQKNNVKHTLTSVRHPAANGQVERVNRVLLPMIMSSTKKDDHSDWDHCIADVEKKISSFANKTTGFSPYQALYGYSPQFYDEDAIEIANVAKNETWIPPTVIREEIRSRIIAAQEKMKNWFDQKHYSGIKNEVGEIVFGKKASTATGTSTKLQNRFRGPFVVTQVLPSDTYRVSYLPGRPGKVFTTTFHVSDLKPWRPQKE